MSIYLQMHVYLFNEMYWKNNTLCNTSQSNHADLDRSRICYRSLPSLIKGNLGHPVNFENNLETKIIWLKRRICKKKIRRECTFVLNSTSFQLQIKFTRVLFGNSKQHSFGRNVEETYRLPLPCLYQFETVSGNRSMHCFQPWVLTGSFLYLLLPSGCSCCWR